MHEWHVPFLEINIMLVTPSKGCDKTGEVGLPKVYTHKTSDSNNQEDDNQSTPFLLIIRMKRKLNLSF
ncbi:hypothetical protein GCA01S_115_00020 [Parageobacillus caldoxylosilyticus NBRC 107762]|uniref:Uncharacterized protein n=1 Tax=Parageobacillus caldoxylosilyticus NBRC 107762 TaxID=1220594 RepID=A0A023DKR7_9BACL|nr:hypothetical protein GCA01S_115_00020 [Parageobacillus caldoxylosilyticus NBRC 107762]